MAKLQKTVGQADFFHQLATHDIVFLDGLFGTGKTYITIKAACEFLNRQSVKKILITRAIIECDNSIGFLPGDIHEKVEPYFLEHKNYVNEFVAASAHKMKVEYQPIELLRSRNYEDTFIILDEAQNCTKKQILMLISRMSINSKLVIVGDAEQSDISDSFFVRLLRNKHRIHSAGFCTLTEQDFFRNKVALELYKDLHRL